MIDVEISLKLCDDRMLSPECLQKSLFLIGIYLFDLRTIQAGEYLIDDSLFKVLMKMKLGETITYKFVISEYIKLVEK